MRAPALASVMSVAHLTLGAGAEKSRPRSPVSRLGGAAEASPRQEAHFLHRLESRAARPCRLTEALAPRWGTPVSAATRR